MSYYLFPCFFMLIMLYLNNQLANARILGGIIMHKFERHTKTIITFSVMAIMLLLFLELLFWPRELFLGNEITFSLIIILFEALYVGIAVVVLAILPPDFDYGIQIHLTYIVIIFSEDDYRKLDRNFDVISSNEE